MKPHHSSQWGFSLEYELMHYFKNNFKCLSQFQISRKVARKYRELLYTPHPISFPLLLTICITMYVCHKLKINNDTLLLTQCFDFTSFSLIPLLLLFWNPTQDITFSHYALVSSGLTVSQTFLALMTVQFQKHCSGLQNAPQVWIASAFFSWLDRGHGFLGRRPQKHSAILITPY